MASQIIYSQDKVIPFFRDWFPILLSTSATTSVRGFVSQDVLSAVGVRRLKGQQWMFELDEARVKRLPDTQRQCCGVASVNTCRAEINNKDAEQRDVEIKTDTKRTVKKKIAMRINVISMWCQKTEKVSDCDEERNGRDTEWGSVEIKRTEKLPDKHGNEHQLKETEEINIIKQVQK